jgi:tRNA-splicing ligase RtcB
LIEREIPVGFEQKREPFDAALDWMRARRSPRASEALVRKAVHQLGTLGGGNHFIEVCRDDADGLLWLLLHSGSRNVGKTVAEIHIGKAKSGVKKLAESLPDPDLAFFVAGTPEFRECVNDV